MKKPLLLMILDGFGIASKEANAIYAANTPNLDKFFSENPITKLSASGIDVGLPNEQMGNSEVGHTNIGAGRIVYQELTRINKSIIDGDFYKNKEFLNAIDNAIKNNKSLHLMGLLSDGGVHSHSSHLYELLKLAKDKNIKNVYIHAILDGRDVSPNSGKSFIIECENKIKEIGIGKIATVMGRYYAMDRDNRFDRVKKAYDAMVLGEGESFLSAKSIVEYSYKNNITDEFIIPAICEKRGKILEGDSIIFFNFRPDRAREITRAFVDSEFMGFKIENKLSNLFFVCMTQYDKNISNVHVSFKPQKLKNTFGEYISSKGLSQLRIAETEKYAHVTFFFNGGFEKPYKNEDRILISSPKVATYDLKPEMSAYEITDKVVSTIKSNKYDVIILNFANCDMVGHTGIFDATIKAVEVVDFCAAKVVDAVYKNNGITIITADHGNADKMYDKDHKPFTAHTTNPVPFCIIGGEYKLKSSGKLSDISPTMIEILNLPKPLDMDGCSLII